MTKTTNKYAAQMTEKVTLADLVAERHQWYEMQEVLQKTIRHKENMVWDLEQKLDIATKALNEYANCENWSNIYDRESPDYDPVYRAIKWKDEFGYKYAQNKLKQIKEYTRGK